MCEEVGCALEAYRTLRTQLRELLADGGADSEAEEDLLNQLDIAWWAMTIQNRELLEKEAPV